MSEQVVTSIEPHDEIVLVAVQCARLDEELTGQMQTELAAAAEQARRLPVVLDLSQVEFFPSLALGTLVRSVGQFKKHGQRFMLVGLQPSVRGALAITRLDKLFEIYDTVDDALAQIRLGGPSA